MKEKYQPVIGDVIYHPNRHDRTPMVVVKYDNYEDMGSCSYARTYYMIEENYLKNNQGHIVLDTLIKDCFALKVTGVEFPEIEQVKNIAPYEIEKVMTLKVRQKEAKIVTIYE
ncbi:MAG: hypothetical protein ABTA16_16960 [Niallia sp.]